MAAVENEELYVWPDLGRFGVSLTMACNPSADRRFLKLTIHNRALFAHTSGADNDNLNVRMREAGFAYSANETAVNAARAYDAALQQGGGIQAAERAAAEAREALFFYSTATVIKQARLKIIIPAIGPDDFRSLPASRIRHTDFQFLSQSAMSGLIRSQQRLKDAEAGVFYTTPLDRALTETFASATQSVHEVLEYRDLPPVEATPLVDFSGDLAALLDFHPVQIMERAVRQQTLGLDGMPMRAPRLSATFAGYATRSQAIAANGGNADGIERVHFEFATPVAFDARNGRLLVLKDARYLEYSAAHIPEEEELYSVQRHLDFMSGVHTVYSFYQQLRVESLLEADAWVDRDATTRAKELSEAMFKAMKDALAPVAPTRGFIEASDIARFGSQREARFEHYHPAEFIRFLRVFQTQMYNAVQQRWAELAARATYEQGVGKFLARLASAPNHDLSTGANTQRASMANVPLTLGELAGIADHELVAEVTKVRVWPEPDALAMRAAGIAPEIAYAIREFHRHLPLTPYAGGMNSRRTDLDARRSSPLVREMHENFVRAVTLVRDSLDGVRSREELEIACERIRVESGIDAGPASRAASWFVDGAGSRFVEEFLPRRSQGGDNDVSRPNAIGLMIEVAKAKTSNGWNWAMRTKTRVGERAAAPLRERVFEVTEARQPVARHLMNIERRGANYRAGIDVTEEGLKDIFKVRSIEYGIWLPESERQLVLNHTFDAFMDLAETLSLMPAAIGLNGELALAFGARGVGGTGAPSALYESGRRVLNLTRMSGAGAVAREWARAFDAWLARSTGLSDELSVTEVASHAGNAMRVMPPVLRDLAGLLQAAKTTPMSRAEVVRAWSSANVDGGTITATRRLSLCIEGWIGGMEAMLPQTRQQGSFRTFAVRRLAQEWETVAGLEEYGMQRLRDAAAFSADVCARMDLEMGSREWRQRINEALPEHMARVHASVEANVRRALQAYSPELYRKNTQFFADALWYDEQRKTPFWATDVELFARSFASWVQDCVERVPGSCSQYLVFGCEENPDAEHSAYPRGADRNAIFARFDEFFRAHANEISRLLAGERGAEYAMLAERPGQHEYSIDHD